MCGHSFDATGSKYRYAQLNAIISVILNFRRNETMIHSKQQTWLIIRNLQSYELTKSWPCRSACCAAHLHRIKTSSQCQQHFDRQHLPKLRRRRDNNNRCNCNSIRTIVALWSSTANSTTSRGLFIIK